RVNSATPGDRTGSRGRISNRAAAAAGTSAHRHASLEFFRMFSSAILFITRSRKELEAAILRVGRIRSSTSSSRGSIIDAYLLPDSADGGVFRCRSETAT